MLQGIVEEHGEGLESAAHSDLRVFPSSRPADNGQLLLRKVEKICRKNTTHGGNDTSLPRGRRRGAERSYHFTFIKLSSSAGMPNGPPANLRWMDEHSEMGSQAQSESGGHRVQKAGRQAVIQCETHEGMGKR